MGGINSEAVMLTLLALDPEGATFFPGWWGIDGEAEGKIPKGLPGASCVLEGGVFQAVTMPLSRHGDGSCLSDC